MQQPSEASQADTQPGFNLDPIEVRALGVLIEKSFITPDNYPLSVNALAAGCNQLTGREPVMSLSDETVLDALRRLSERGLVSQRHQAGARVVKWEHQIRLRHSLTLPQQAILAILMLRGAQTAGELRARSERLHAFGDIAEVEAVLEQLADKYPPMAAPLPRAPGAKETRHVHLLGGDAVLTEVIPTADAAAPRGSRMAELEDEVRRLRQQVAWLTDEFENFRKQFE
ncbi:MAG: DUF480 domain-containing protein [Zoogloea sp.]|nr:DUF480 domain-containing protein [Zoogloea sp.]